MNIENLYKELGQLKRQIELEEAEVAARVEKYKGWLLSTSLPLGDGMALERSKGYAGALATLAILPQRHKPLLVRIFELEQQIANQKP